MPKPDRALARLKLRIAQNELGYHDRLIREQHLCDRMPRPLEYLGFDAAIGKARVRQLGGDIVLADSITNGAIPIGSSVPGASTGGFLRIDSMPRVVRREVTPDRVLLLDDLLYVYRINNSFYFFDRNGRVLLDLGSETLATPLSQAFYLRNQSKICSIRRSRVDPPILFFNGASQAWEFNQSEAYYLVPSGYNIWSISLIAPLIGYTETTTGNISTSTFFTLQPDYLVVTGGGTRESTEGSSDFFYEMDYTIEYGSVFLDGRNQQVYVEKSVFQRNIQNSIVNQVVSGAENSSMSGNTIVFPGVLKPASSSHAGDLGTLDYVSSTSMWEPILYDENAARAICLYYERDESAVGVQVNESTRLRNISYASSVSAWVVNSDGSEVECNSEPIVRGTTNAATAIAIGPVTVSGSNLWSYARIRTYLSEVDPTTDVFIDPPGVEALIGQSVAVVSRDGNGAITKGLGIITDAESLEGSLTYTSVTVEVSEVFQVPYDSILGNFSTVLYSNNHSVYMLLEHFTVRGEIPLNSRSYGIPFGYGIRPSVYDGVPDITFPAADGVSAVKTTLTNQGALITLGYSWADDAFYLIQKTNLPTDDQSIVYVEKWKVVIEGGRYSFVKEPQPIPIRTNAIYAAGESLLQIVGSIHL